MSDIKEKFVAAAALTITLNSLASSNTVGRESTAIDNSTNLYVDALVEVLVTTANSTMGSDKAVYVFAYASLDGTTYSGGATGSDAGHTRQDPTVLAYLGSIQTPTQNIAYRSKPFSVAQVFGGILPPKWGIVVFNFTNQALAGSGNSAQYVPVYYTTS